MLAPIKRFFLSQTCGILLCILALFLIGNTLYLNTIRDRKFEAVDTIGQALDDYQLELGYTRKAGLPEALNQDIQFGSLLKMVLSTFKIVGKDITVTKVMLTEEERSVLNPDAGILDFPPSHQKKKKEPERVQILQISGSINNSQAMNSYSQLNEVIAQIKTENGCQFSLQRAVKASDSEQKAQENQPVNFDISLIPVEQKNCARKFSRSGGPNL